MTVKTVSRLLIVSLYLKKLPIHQRPGKFQEVKAAFHGCLSNTTGHGLPQIVKPGNLFLNVLWVIFYVVAVSGCGFMIYQAVDQFCQFDVITMTKIKRETEMELPAVTICSPDENTYNMIIECSGPSDKECIIKNLTLYDRGSLPEYCVQLNSGKNVTELQSNEGLGFGYILTLYKHKVAHLYLAFTDNSARVVLEDVKEIVFFGQFTELVLSKTVHTALGPPHSNCNQSTDYRQVNCIEDCDKSAMKEACGCGYDVECPELSDQMSELSEKCLNVVLSKCNQECPVECNQVSFQSKRVDIELEMILDYVEGSTNYYKSIVEKKFSISEYSDDEFKKRITMLFINFDKLETTEITQSPSISLTSLIANVGGLLGKSIHSPSIFKIYLAYQFTHF